MKKVALIWMGRKFLLSCLLSNDKKRLFPGFKYTHSHSPTHTCTLTLAHTYPHSLTYLRPHTTLFVFVGCNWGSVFVVQEHDSSNLSSKAGENYFLWLKIRIFLSTFGWRSIVAFVAACQNFWGWIKVFLTNLKNAIFVESVAFHRFMAAFEPISCRKWKWDSSGTLMNFVSIATANQSCRRFVWCQCVDKVYQLTARWCLSSSN